MMVKINQVELYSDLQCFEKHGQGGSVLGIDMCIMYINTFHQFKCTVYQIHAGVRGADSSLVSMHFSQHHITAHTLRIQSHGQWSHCVSCSDIQLSWISLAQIVGGKLIHNQYFIVLIICTKLPDKCQ